MNDLPLSGIRVLDLTRVLAGPFCSALLADLGAEVIKVESRAGDDYRHLPPFADGQGALFLLLNRGKQSVVLDLKSEQGQRIGYELAVQSDVVLENFRPGVMARLGLGYERLAAARPELIYASISGFGQDGPMANLPAYDLVIQAMTGLMDVTGDPDGPPTMTGESIADLTAGLFASWAILAALFARERSGKGQQIDVSMFDCLFNFLPASLAQHLYGDREPRRVGNRHPLGSPFGVFAARDGHYTIAVLTEPQFAKLAGAIGRADLPGDQRFTSNEARARHHDDLKAIIESWSAGLSTAEAVACLEQHGVPASPIWSVATAAASQQVRHRGLLEQLAGADGRTTTVMRQPVSFSGAARRCATPPPALGQDTASVLRRVLGLDDTNLAALERDGVIATS